MTKPKRIATVSLFVIFSAWAGFMMYSNAYAAGGYCIHGSQTCVRSFKVIDGLYKQTIGKDSDGDGVNDFLDSCNGVKGVKENDGCEANIYGAWQVLGQSQLVPVGAQPVVFCHGKLDESLKNDAYMKAPDIIDNSTDTVFDPSCKETIGGVAYDRKAISLIYNYKAAKYCEDDGYPLSHTLCRPRAYEALEIFKAAYPDLPIPNDATWSQWKNLPRHDCEKPILDVVSNNFVPFDCPVIDGNPPQHTKKDQTCFEVRKNCGTKAANEQGVENAPECADAASVRGHRARLVTCR